MKYLLLFVVSTMCFEPLCALPLSHSSRRQTELHLFQGSFPEREGRLDQDVRNVSDKKSPALAALYSLVVPGMGEYYSGDFSSGKYFLAGEGVLWLTYTVFELYGNSLRDDSRAFAASRAGIDPGGKNNQFFVDIGNFLSVAEYNEKQLRDREPEKLYDASSGYSWRWDSEESRVTYRGQRIDAENMFNNRKFVIAAVIINHVASAINAARSAISHNNSLDNAGSLSFHADVQGGLLHPHGIVLTVSKGF